MRPERSPALSGKQDSKRPNSSHSPTEVSHVHDSSFSSRSRSHTRVKGKGKRRASTRSPESDISSPSPLACHERTGSPEVLVTPNLSFFENTPERNAAVSCAATGDALGEALPQTPENDTPVVSPRLPDGDPSIAIATLTTDDRLSPVIGPRSLNDEIISSSSSKSETPKLTINTNRARANPMRMRQPKYRSQRDTIIAHLRGSVTTPRRSTQSLLARMTDQTVAELDVVGDDDADVAKRTVGTTPPGGENHVYFAPGVRTAKRSSGLSDSDDPPGGPKKEDSEKRVVDLIQSVQGMIVIYLATRALITTIYVNVSLLFLYFNTELSGPPSIPPCSTTSSHAHLLDRLYDDDDATATTTEARLRTQVRLRARLAAERRLAHDNV